MSPDSVEKFEILMGLKLEGIGASLQGNDGYTVVKKIIPGGAAEKEGHLKLEDKVIGRGRRREGRVGRRRRHEAQRRGEADPRQARHGRPPAGHSRARTPSRKTIKITRAEIELKDSEAQGEVFEPAARPTASPTRWA